MGFPTLLLAVFGSLPATTKPDAALGGLSFFEVYLPAMTALCLGLLALIGLPVPTTSYRELGVLRRMATTPVPPSWLLGAQVVVNVVLLLVAVLVVVLGGVALGAHLPLQALGFVLSVLLAGAAMFVLGLWVAAIARTQRAAGAIGATLFYPMMFFAGVWLPREAMAPALADRQRSHAARFSSPRHRHLDADGTVSTRRAAAGNGGLGGDLRLAVGANVQMAVGPPYRRRMRGLSAIREGRKRQVTRTTEMACRPTKPGSLFRHGAPQPTSATAPRRAFAGQVDQRASDSRIPASRCRTSPKWKGDPESLGRMSP